MSYVQRYGLDQEWSKSPLTVPKIQAWLEVGVDLSKYQGQEVEIRFKFDTVDQYGWGEGLYIDNIIVSHGC